MEQRRQQVSLRCWTAKRPSAPARSAVRLISAAAAASTPLSSRGGGGRPWASTTCRPRSRRRQRRGRGRAWLCRRRRDEAAVGEPGDVRLLPRHRLLPGSGRRPAFLPGARCLCAGQSRATLLLLSFGPGRWRSLVGGVARRWSVGAPEPPIWRVSHFDVGGTRGCICGCSDRAVARAADTCRPWRMGVRSGCRPDAGRRRARRARRAGLVAGLPADPLAGHDASGMVEMTDMPVIGGNASDV
jgi:hypothetical protein